MTQELTPLPTQNPSVGHRGYARRSDIQGVRSGRSTPDLVTGAATARGKRAENEDQFLFAPYAGDLRTSLEPAPQLGQDALPSHCMLALVADGMGGPGHGALASSLVTRWVLAGLRSVHFQLDAPCATLARLMNEAHLQLQAVARARNLPLEFGTTATVAWLQGQRLNIAHVGDSRLYVQRRGVMRCLTTDQTYAERLRRRGQLHGRAVHPRLEHTLWSALTGGSPPHVDVMQTDLQRGDTLLLCSDGVYGPLDHDRIGSLLQSPNPSTAATRLVEYAHAKGGTDDATAVVIHVV